VRTQQYCTDLKPDQWNGHVNRRFRMAGTNTLISGPARLTGQTLTGLTLGQVRSRFADALNIPDGATATVNGIAVGEEQVIVDGEEVLFAKPLGQKG
jgi:hypothetical protein